MEESTLNLETRTTLTDDTISTEIDTNNAGWVLGIFHKYSLPWENKLSILVISSIVRVKFSPSLTLSLSPLILLLLPIPIFLERWPLNKSEKELKTKCYKINNI